MIEVFVGYSKSTDVQKLEETLDAWMLKDLEPVAVELVPGRKYELIRRVSAENISKDNYILAEIGYGPLEENFAELAAQELENHSDVGLFGVPCVGTAHFEPPAIVMICRKGIIKHWIPAHNDEASYVKKHVDTVHRAGYKVFLSSTLHYHSLAVELLQ